MPATSSSSSAPANISDTPFTSSSTNKQYPLLSEGGAVQPMESAVDAAVREDNMSGGESGAVQANTRSCGPSISSSPPSLPSLLSLPSSLSLSSSSSTASASVPPSFPTQPPVAPSYGPHLAPLTGSPFTRPSEAQPLSVHRAPASSLVAVPLPAHNLPSSSPHDAAPFLAPPPTNPSQEEKEMMETASEAALREVEDTGKGRSMRAVMRHLHEAEHGQEVLREQAAQGVALERVIRSQVKGVFTLGKRYRKEMSNVGHSYIRSMVYQKAVKYGCAVFNTLEENTSRGCVCGKKGNMSGRTFVCSHCHFRCDRDIKATMLILAKALFVPATKEDERILG